jgi:beta-glucosidase
MEAIYQGLDMEFGSWTNGLNEGDSNAYDNYYLAKPFLKLIQSEQVKEEEVDKKVRNILRLAFRTTMNTERPWGSFATPEHAAAGRKIAEEGIVLLQNKNNVLPIDLNKIRKILVVGENAIKPMTVGGGSSSLKAKYEVAPLDGIISRAGSQTEVIYARGYVGDPTSTYNGVELKRNLNDSRSAGELIAEATGMAETADVVIFIGGLNKSNYQDAEGNDRKALGLPYGQDKVITELLKANKNLVVVNISGNAVAMPWVNDAPAIVQSWYNGTESGNALAAVLVGDVNPSGKLPFTFPAKLEDNGAHKLGEYPGNGQVTYNEGIFVGYRWTDKEKIKPLFPFGHGLSYTTFAYGKVIADKKEMIDPDRIIFTVPVKNTGSRDGAEVVQLYISDKISSLERPLKELKGFEKVYLKAGEEKNVTFSIDKDALNFFDPARHDWIAEPGTFEALIGASANDIKTKITFELK